jgi:hypothetical protein
VVELELHWRKAPSAELHESFSDTWYCNARYRYKANISAVMLSEEKGSHT